jgi:twitching motility protein PilT
MTPKFSENNERNRNADFQNFLSAFSGQKKPSEEDLKKKNLFRKKPRPDIETNAESQLDKKMDAEKHILSAEKKAFRSTGFLMTESQNLLQTTRYEDSGFLMGTHEKKMEAPVEDDNVFLPQPDPYESLMTDKILPSEKQKKSKSDAEDLAESANMIKDDKTIPGHVRENFTSIPLSHISVRAKFTLEQLFETMIREKASDLHISTGSVPALRINGELVPMELPDLDLEYSENLLFPILSEEQRSKFEEEGELDFSFDYRHRNRFRISYFRHHTGIGSVFRHIPNHIPTLQQLGLPPVISNLIKFKKGLILVSGPGSSGKSATIASMLNEINNTQKVRMITLEKPIEYVLRSNLALISQREIGANAISYEDALWAVLREDPDIIMISELWTLNDIRHVLKISETGHLVIAAVHSLDTTKAIEGLVSSFPADEQEQIRIMISECLLGVIAQRLVPRTDNRDRVLAYEILLATTGLASIIREGKFSQIISVIQTGRNLGMQTMDQSLLHLLDRNFISYETAREFVVDNRFLKRTGLSFEK